MLQKADYNENYFNGGGDIGGYTNYASELTYYFERPHQLAQKFYDKYSLTGNDLAGRTVLVLGCAYGYLVKYLVENHGVEAYGMDFSSYAVSQAPPEIASRIIEGDITVEADWDAARTLAGFTKKPDKFDLIIEADVFCCLTDAQAITARDFALANSDYFIHLLEQTTQPDNLLQWYNYKTLAEWKALLGNSPKEKWFSRFDWIEEQ